MDMEEVAKFTKEIYVEELAKLSQFQSGDFGNALTESFHKIDELLEEERFLNLLREYRMIPNPSDLPDVPNAKESSSSKSVSDNAKEMLASNANFTKTETRILEILSHKNIAVVNKSNAKDDQSALAPVQSLDASSSESEAAAALDDIEERITELLLPNGEEEEGIAEVDFTTGVLQEESSTNDFSSNGDEVEVDMEKYSVTSASSNVTEEKVIPETVPVQQTFIITPSGPLCQLKAHRLTAGCTAIVALKVDSKLYVANAGDSRGVLCRGDNQAYALSEDHKPLHVTEYTRIMQGGGYVTKEGRINGNLNLSRSLGDLKYKQNKNISRERQIISGDPDIHVVDLLPDDKFMLLACDGIWDCLTNQQASDFVRERLERGVSDRDIVEQMCQACLSIDPHKAAGIGTDNMTCMIVVFKQ